MELEAIAQRKRVRQLVAAQLVLVHHLRLDLKLGIGGEQRVVDHVPVVAGDVRGGGDGIENAQVSLRNELEHFLPLRPGQRSTQHDSHGDGTESMPA